MDAFLLFLFSLSGVSESFYAWPRYALLASSNSFMMLAPGSLLVELPLGAIVNTGRHVWCEISVSELQTSERGIMRCRICRILHSTIGGIVAASRSRVYDAEYQYKIITG